MQNYDDSMWAKQLASSVRQGRKLTLSILDEELVGGYLAGWDDKTLFILAPFTDDSGDFFNKLLVPRSAILYVQIHEEKTFFDEELFQEMNAVIRPFKDFINKTYFTREN